MYEICRCSRKCTKCWADGAAVRISVHSSVTNDHLIINWRTGGQQRFVQRLNVNRRAPLHTRRTGNKPIHSPISDEYEKCHRHATDANQRRCIKWRPNEKKKLSEPTSSLCSESVSIEAIVVEVVDAAVLFAFGIRPNINEVALSALAYATTPVMARIQSTKDLREFSGCSSDWLCVNNNRDSTLLQSHFVLAHQMW